MFLRPAVAIPNLTSCEHMKNPRQRKTVDQSSLLPCLLILFSCTKTLQKLRVQSALADYISKIRKIKKEGMGRGSILWGLVKLTVSVLETPTWRDSTMPGEDSSSTGPSCNHTVTRKTSLFRIRSCKLISHRYMFTPCVCITPTLIIFTVHSVSLDSLLYMCYMCIRISVDL